MRPWIVLAVNVLISDASLAGHSVEWRYALEAPAGAPTLFPGAESASGVVITAGENVIRLDGKGRAVWTAPQTARTVTPPTVADLDGDGQTEILFCLVTGEVVCLNADGTPRWRHKFDTPPWEGFEMVTAADVLPEPGLEILAGCEDGWLGCLSAKGRLLWRTHGDKFRTSPVAVGDVDGDGAPEIVYGTDNGHVYCLTGWGTVKWRYSELAPYGRSGPNLADLDGDGKVEVLITRSNTGNATCLMALAGSTGTFLWRTKDIMQGYVSNAVVDLDGDGKLEVLHADKGNHVYCTDSNGRHRWRADLGGHGIFWAPGVGDVDADGALEVVVGVRGVDPETKASAYMLGPDGTVEARLSLGGGANVGPAIADIDGDGELEVIFATQNPNQIQALSWNGKGKVAWPSLRGDSAMTATTRVPAGRPISPKPMTHTGGLDARHGRVTWGENVWQVCWQNPAPEDAFIEVSLTSPDNFRETRIEDAKPGSTEADVAWQLKRPGTSIITLRLLGPALGDAEFAFRDHVEPEALEFCELPAVEAACSSAIDAGKRVGADAAAIATRLVSLKIARDAVKELASSGAEGQRIAEAATRLRKQAGDLRAAARALADYWKAGGKGSFVVWLDANPWDRFDPSAVPEQLPLSVGAKVSAYGDEFEDVVLTLLNVTASPIDVRATFVKPVLTNQRPEPASKLAGHVTLRRALRTPSRLGGMRNDALPVLDRSGVVTLAPGEARQLWLVVDTHGLEPGTHRVLLYLGTLSQTPTFREVPIEVEVWPVTLPKVYAKMNWARVDAGVIPDQMVRDMLDHGDSVFYGPSASLHVDAKGGQSEPVDWGRFDATLARLPDYAQVLFPGPPQRIWPKGERPKEKSAEDAAGFQTAVRVLAEHMNSIGWGYDRWAFYPIDEPWLTGETHLPHLRWFCQTVKAADPKTRVYADPAGNVRVEGISKFADLIDVWQPEMNLLKRDPKLVEWFQKNAGEFWAYEAPGPSKDLLPLGHYRAFHWLAWKFGTVGAGYWVYRDVDLWWPVEGGDYGAVYPAGAEVVASRRWEACRDGVEDYRALHVLAGEIAKARKAGLTVDADRGQALIDEAVENIIGWQSRVIDEITRMTRDYEIDFKKLMGYRSRIAREIIQLRKAIEGVKR